MRDQPAFPKGVREGFRDDSIGAGVLKGDQEFEGAEFPMKSILLRILRACAVWVANHHKPGVCSRNGKGYDKSRKMVKGTVAGTVLWVHPSLCHFCVLEHMDRHFPAPFQLNRTA